MMSVRSRITSDGERGAVIVIVALVLIAMFGMVVLVIDVGGLLWKRRELVNASDAAALSGAQTCALTFAVGGDSKTAADSSALQNVTGTGLSGTYSDSGNCHTSGSGWVKVQYSQNQHLYFAPVLGFSNSNGVTTRATAIWGPVGADNPVPVVVYANSFHTCKLDQDPTPGPDCYIWEDNNNTNGSQSGFGFLDLRTSDPTKYGWDSVPGAGCSDAGSDIKNWISTYPNPSVGDLPVHWPNPTYVCRIDGEKQKPWTELAKLVGNTLDFPINRCYANPVGQPFGQIDGVDNSGKPIQVPCANTPAQYDIIGFVALNLTGVYDANDPKVQGTTGACPGQVQMVGSPPTSVNLDQFGALNACFTSAPDVIYTPITVQKAGGGGPQPVEGVDWSYDSGTRTVTWIPGGPANEGQNYTIKFDWAKGGLCGVPPAGNSSGHCITVQVVEVKIGGTPGNGSPDSNIRAVKLCDQKIPGSCLPVSVPNP
jgi:Flp pilus assembly protein TadG